jgi:1-deoxy-D-xylulose 5-phosphate reductoisomerase
MNDDVRARPLTILGSTGSIGINTLSVAAHLGIPIYALSAHSKVELLATQARACEAGDRLLRRLYPIGDCE